MEEFITIKESSSAEIVEKKSKFIANLFYVESIKEAEQIIKETNKKYFDARHNCVAYRIMEDGQLIEKSSDNGEPSGTAGAPMLNILQKNNLANILIIVTRYFGGILLGTGGLVRAYSESLMQAVENSVKVHKCIGYELKVTLEYGEFEIFKYYCKNHHINIVETEYNENIICKIQAREDVKEMLLEDFRLKNIKLIHIEELYKKFITKYE